MVFMGTAEILSINPLYPPILGDILSWGTPPDPRQEVSCTSFSAVSYGIRPEYFYANILPWPASGFPFNTNVSPDGLECLKSHFWLPDLPYLAYQVWTGLQSYFSWLPS